MSFDNLKLERPWRCDVTGNPVGTDTFMVGYTCDCQGCRAADSLASKDTALAERDETIARMEKKLAAFRDDGLVQAAIARQGSLQDERDEAIESLAEIRAELEMWRTVKHSSHWQARAKAAESELALVKKALEEERERNRKLHRRAQSAEAVNQSVEGILAAWKDALKDRYAPHNQKWLLFSLPLDDIVNQRTRLEER